MKVGWRMVSYNSGDRGQKSLEVRRSLIATDLVGLIGYAPPRSTTMVRLEEIEPGSKRDPDICSVFKAGLARGWLNPCTRQQPQLTLAFPLKCHAVKTRVLRLQRACFPSGLTRTSPFLPRSGTEIVSKPLKKRWCMQFLSLMPL